jgi:glycosyltransferase involved in cell wall biosynthesis
MTEMTETRIEHPEQERSDPGHPVVQVILPVLDEADALGWVLGRMPPGYEPLVVDNGSTDSSVEIARSYDAHVVVEPRRGFGAACFAGLCSATSDLVAFMDADASLDPLQLPLVVGPVAAGNADLVLGSRDPEPRAWPVSARVANRALCLELRRRGAPRLKDIGPMRACRRSGLLALGMEDRRFGWPLEMVLKAVSSGWRVAEVDVAYRRREGRSKVTGTVKGTLRAVRDMGQVLR